jgi:hypothetical protein
MGVTAFKSLSNFSGQTVTIINAESGSQRDILANTARGFDYWVPWCTRQGDFPRHHIELEVPKGTKRYWIWQSQDADGDFVRYSEDGQYHGRDDGLSNGGRAGTHVPGFAGVDGNRLIVVDATGRFEVKYSG